jgi:microcystin-dependent protein
MSSNKIVNLVNPTNAQDAATKTYVDTSIPIGGIIMWSGANNTWPSNWRICDGTNGTPDLRGRFVLSSGQGSGLTNRTTGQTGGEQTVTLAETHMPSHTHGVSARTGHPTTGAAYDGDHAHTVSASGTPVMPIYNSEMLIFGRDRISLLSPSAASDSQGTVFYGSVSVSGTASNNANAWNGSAGTLHNHTITVSEDAKGSGTAHENMPPFYVLAFIMRVS